MDSGARAATLPDVLVERRFHEHNVSNINEDQQRAALAAAMKAHLDRVRARRTRS
jgi:hypothetical protein